MGDTLPTRGRVLVVDDEESLRHALGRSLRRAGFEVVEAATGREGVDRFAEGGVDAVLTDMRLPDLDGLDLVAIFTQRSPEVPVVVMTGYGSMETALEAMRRGARDFVQKPFGMEEAVRLVVRVMGERRLSEENRRLRALVERRFAPEGFHRVEEELRAIEGKGAGSGERGEAPAEAGATLPPGPAAPEGEPVVPGAGEPLAMRDAHRQFEIRYVEELLARTGGNVAAAARLAGISRPNFHKKLRTLGIDATRFKQAARRGRAHDL